MEDTQIVQKVIDGDIDSYACIVEKYKDLVFSISYQILGNYEDAEDMSQEVFIKAFKKLSTYNQEKKFSNWLYRITMNTSISKKRRKKFWNINIEDINLSTELELAMDHKMDDVDIAERNQLIGKALDQLKKKEKLLILLRYYHNCSIEDMAEITQMTNGNIRSKLFRIRKKLYSLLTPVKHEYLN